MKANNGTNLVTLPLQIRYFNIRRENETIYKTVLDLLIRSLSGIDSWQNKIKKKTLVILPLSIFEYLRKIETVNIRNSTGVDWAKNRGIKHGKIIVNVNKKFRWQKTEKESLQVEYV